MSNFKSILDKWGSFDFDKFIKTSNKNIIEDILHKDYLTDTDFLTLLTPASDSFLEKLAQKAHKRTVNEFGKTIQIYTPLYLSNFCTNRCIYCGFNRDNRIERDILSLKEIENECMSISEKGLKHILLLTGGDRVKTSINYIKSAVLIARKYFSSISIEMYSMTSDEYSTLADLGVENVTLYQETYNCETYKKVHLSGEKSDYDFRLNAPERAAEAGIRSLNLGVLLGLSEPIKDFFLAGLHCSYIQKKFPGVNVSISLPRIKEATGGYQTGIEVSDKQLAKFIIAFRLFIQKGGISISTRESECLRDNLIPLGVTKMSAESKTKVGGHIKNDGINQFETSDKRTVEEFHASIKAKGYQPVYKDWVTI